jgi:Uma2 family endonuclease
MTDLLIRSECYDEPKNVRVADVPIDFETWLEISHSHDTELIKGVMVERMAAQYPHEWIFGWLLRVLGNYAHNRKLGVVLGSRTAVKIDRYDGRLPDLLFVRADNLQIIHNDAIYGTPDLVIEIVSPNDRNGDLIALQTDYRTIGVPEIVFIDPQKQHVRLFRKTGPDSYDDITVSAGRLTFDCIPGFWVEAEWGFTVNQPNELEHSNRLAREAEEGAG